jgi:hypothetical protein
MPGQWLCLYLGVFFYQSCITQGLSRRGWQGFEGGLKNPGQTLTHLGTGTGRLVETAIIRILVVHDVLYTERKMQQSFYMCGCIC